MATIAERIAAIDAKLEQGVSQHNVDGTSTTYDLNALRTERQRLIDELAGYRTKQRCAAVRLDG